jgi:hypothetical protein
MMTGFTSLTWAARYESFRSSYKAVPRTAMILLGTTFWSAEIAVSTALLCLIESGAKAKEGAEGTAILLDVHASTVTRNLTIRDEENIMAMLLTSCCQNVQSWKARTWGRIHEHVVNKEEGSKCVEIPGEINRAAARGKHGLGCTLAYFLYDEGYKAYLWSIEYFVSVLIAMCTWDELFVMAFFSYAIDLL